VNIKDDIVDLAWSPKASGTQVSSQGDSKEKYFVLTKNGLVEE